MKKIRVQDAVGQTLFHDMTAILENGYKGPRFRRGHVVREEDIPVLLKMGKDHIYIWEDDPAWVHEEDAAREVLEAGIGRGLTIPEPSEGRFAVKAEYDGLFVLNREGLLAINRVPDYTFATLPDARPVRKGEVCVGARIVPLVTAAERVSEAKEAAEHYKPLFEVWPYRPLKVGLVITGTEIYEGRIKDAFEAILRRKLEAYGVEILGAEICPDDLSRITKAAEKFAAEGAGLVLLTGGMSVDPDDLTPTAIRELSDEFLFQGLPVQPGNMLTVGKRDGLYFVGVPGASIHSPVTSLDLFLPMIFAGRDFDRETALRMGEGGLSICRSRQAFMEKN